MTRLEVIRNVKIAIGLHYLSRFLFVASLFWCGALVCEITYYVSEYNDPVRREYLLDIAFYKSFFILWMLIILVALPVAGRWITASAAELITARTEADPEIIAQAFKRLRRTVHLVIFVAILSVPLLVLGYTGG